MSNIVFNGKEKTNKSSAERKPRKPNYNENAILQEQKDDAVHLYNSDMSLQAIADELSLNPIKVRKLLITAGVYESNTAESVQNTFNMYRKKQSYKDAVLPRQPPFSFPKYRSPHICLMRKVCTFRQRNRRKSV